MVDRIGGLPAEAPRANAEPPRGSVMAGIPSGLAGGLAMLAFLALCAGVQGLGWLHPLESIGATLVDAGASSGAAVAAGALLHAVASAAFGIGLAALLPESFPRGSSVGVGVAYGLFAAGFMMSLVVPAVNPAFRAAVQPVGGSWTIGHAVFGATLGLALSVRRRGATRGLEQERAVARAADPT